MAMIRIFPAFGHYDAMTKHEIIRCQRCQSVFECKANSFTKCQCAKVQLTLNETQYVSESYDACLCNNCLLAMREEYRLMFSKLLPGSR